MENIRRLVSFLSKITIITLFFILFLLSTNNTFYLYYRSAYFDNAFNITSAHVYTEDIFYTAKFYLSSLSEWSYFYTGLWTILPLFHGAMLLSWYLTRVMTLRDFFSFSLMISFYFLFSQRYFPFLLGDGLKEWDFPYSSYLLWSNLLIFIFFSFSPLFSFPLGFKRLRQKKRFASSHSLPFVLSAPSVSHKETSSNSRNVTVAVSDRA